MAVKVGGAAGVMTKTEHKQTARALKAEAEVQRLIAVLAQMRGQQAQAEAARLGAELDALGTWTEAPVAIVTARAGKVTTRKRKG